MKLRNKKTGEVMDLECVTIFDRPDKYNSGDSIDELYSLAELNDRWEDYELKDPLIKDEKIRKAVRAWAEAQGLTEVYCTSNGYEIYGGDDDLGIQFEGEPFPFADRNRTYTIAELCGEEEE